MILSNEGIRSALASGEIVINPAPVDNQYTTSAVDLFIGDDFSRWDRGKFDVPGVHVNLDLAVQTFQRTANAYLEKVQPNAEGNVVFPPYAETKSHLLAITRETIHLTASSRIAARVEGRSSLARLGIIVHLTAPVIHAGFKGVIVLEMINFSPFYITHVHHKTRICQLVFERLETAPTVEIATAFQGQTGAH